MVDSYYDGPVSGYAERNGIVRGPEPQLIEKGTRVRIAEGSEEFGAWGTNDGTVIGYAMKYYKVRLDGFDYSRYEAGTKCHLFGAEELEVVT